MLSKLRNRQKGFTLIELLIVVAIIGIIAAILIPNFLDALHKGRQKRTMGDIRQFGLALGTLYSERGGAAAAGAVTIQVGDWDNSLSFDDLETAIVPNYASSIPRTDAWDNNLEYYVTLVDPPRVGYALVRAPGLGGEFEGDEYESGSFDPSDYEADIVWADGGFVRAPKSILAAGT